MQVAYKSIPVRDLRTGGEFGFGAEVGYQHQQTTRKRTYGDK